MRRTKEDAGKTRAAIVDAALTCFDRHGITGSTLEQIACEARVTKGAVYHHFAGKREILHEIREQVTIPLMDEADTALLESGEVPALLRVERFLLSILESLRTDSRMRTALSVMQFKCEYVDDLAGELAGAVQKNERLIRAFEAAYRDAAKKGQLAKALSPEIAALETLMFLGGLVRLLLIHGPRSRIGKQAAGAVKSHVASRRR